MTKKHFILIAQALNFETESPEAEYARVNAIHRIADVLASQNPLFDRGRFLEACDAVRPVATGMGSTEAKELARNLPL